MGRNGEWLAGIGTQSRRFGNIVHFAGPVARD